MCLKWIFRYIVRSQTKQKVKRNQYYHNNKTSFVSLLHLSLNADMSSRMCMSLLKILLEYI